MEKYKENKVENRKETAMYQCANLVHKKQGMPKLQWFKLNPLE